EIGGATHFPAARLMDAIGQSWTIAPVGATANRFASLKGGFTDVAFMSPLWLERAKGELRGLAVVGPERWPDAPDMPTVREAGYDVDACLNRRYWAPKDTPQEHVDILADAIEAAANTERVKDYLKRTGEELKILRGDELR